MVCNLLVSQQGAELRINHTVVSFSFYSQGDHFSDQPEFINRPTEMTGEVEPFENRSCSTQLEHLSAPMKLSMVDLYSAQNWQVKRVYLYNTIEMGKKTNVQIPLPLYPLQFHPCTLAQHMLSLEMRLPLLLLSEFVIFMLENSSRRSPQGGFTASFLGLTCAELGGGGMLLGSTLRKWKQYRHRPPCLVPINSKL